MANSELREESSVSLNMSASILVLRIKLVIRYLVQKWWVVVIAGVVGGSLGFAVAYVQKPIYESRLTFALEDKNKGLGGALSLAAEFGLNLGGSNGIFDGENINTLLTSRRVIEAALLSTDTLNGQVRTMADYLISINNDSLKKKGQNSDSRLLSISFPVGQQRSQFSYLQDSILFLMYKSFSEGELVATKPDKRLNIYEVSVKSLNERFTKIFTEKIVGEAIAFYTAMRSKRSKETLEILENRVKQIKGELNFSITGKAVIQDADINPAFQQAAAVAQKKQVDITAFGAAYAELFKSLEMARYQYLNNIPLLQVIDGANYPMHRIKKGKIKTAIAYGFIFSIASVFILICIQFYQSITRANTSEL